MRGSTYAELRGPAEADIRRSAPLLTVPIPQQSLERLVEVGLPQLRARARVAWERPQLRSSLFGFGVAARVRGPRNSPIGDARAALEQALAGATDAGVAHAARPRAFGGGRFAPGGSHADRRWERFGGWEFTVPSLLVAFHDGQASGSLTLRADSAPSPDDVDCFVQETLERSTDGPAALDPGGQTEPASPEGWQQKVAAVLAEIAAGRYQKAVLARPVDVPLPGVDVGAVLSRLADRYPGCFIFKYRSRAGDWLGASPERLASLEDGVLRALCLAGSRPRGGDEAVDDRLRDELLSSPKEREEHELVRAAIASSIGPFCSTMAHPSEPAVVRMANIQHLSTPFEGKIRPGASLLDVVASLHPTPAVGGSPRREALEAIDRIEEMDRGWYAGPIGWVDFDGEGEFAVGLRSGLVGAESARLYAGAGIVAGSNPANEYAETETKLRPLRESLAGA